MNAYILASSDAINYSEALRPYGFDTFSADGDVPSGPYDGYMRDFYTAGEGVRWMRTQQAWRQSGGGQPFFMVLSFLNPHDIMYADANLPGQPAVQRAAAHRACSRLRRPIRIYAVRWNFPLPSSLDASLTAPACQRRCSNTTAAGRARWA